MVLAIGTRLAGRYEVLAPLGAGGMGEVYRARDLRLKRDVAVKVLPTRLERDPEAQERFEAEAHALASLQHPHVLTLHDFGTEGELHYAVTEVLEGETLRERLGRGPVPWRKAVEWTQALAEGLAAVHARGIVHRDVKPENVFLTNSGTVKVLDFGLAAPQPGAGIATSTSGEGDATDPLVGTLHYMSPELLRGEALDHRADIFGLGCVLYELLAGRRLFARETPAGTLAAILSEDPPELSPSSAEPLPPGLEQAVQRCLRKQPDERFQSMQDLVFALEMISITSGSGRITRPLLPQVPPARPRRWPWLFALAALALAALGLWLAFGGHADPLDSLAVLPFANATNNAELEYLSDGLSEGVISNLAELQGLRVMAWNTVRRYKHGTPDAQQVGRDLNVRAVLVGRLEQRGEDLRIEAELVDVLRGAQLWSRSYVGRPQDLAAMPERIAQQIAESLQQRVARGSNPRRRAPEDAETYRLYLQGRHQWNKRTPEGFHQAIDFFQRALERDPQYALAHAGIADAYTLLGAFSMLSPREAMEPARVSAQRALELDESLAEPHASLGLVHLLYDWRFGEAEAELQRAIALRPGYATAHHWFAELLMTQRRYPQALEELQRAEQIDPLSLIILTDIGRVHYHARRFLEAERQFRKVVELEDGFSFAHTMLGFALADQRRYAEAEAELVRGMQLSKDDPRQKVHLARVQALAGRTQEARATLEAVALIAQRSYVAPFNLATAHTALGDRDKAFELLEAAFAERSQWMPYLDADPRLDPLRGDPRFADLRRRVGLHGEP